MALPMVPAADAKQSLHLKAAGWQAPQGILEFMQLCDGFTFTRFRGPKAPRLKYMPVLLFAVDGVLLISVVVQCHNTVHVCAIVTI